MTPDTAIATLDRALARNGTDAVLRRLTGAAPSVASHDVAVRALVRSDASQALAGGVAQTWSRVVVSPSPITAAAWPNTGEQASSTVADPSLPRRGDKLVIAGRVRNVETVDPIYIASTLVRIDLQVL